MAIPHRLRVRAVREVVDQGGRHDAEAEFVLREVDVEALAGAVAVFEAFEAASAPAMPLRWSVSEKP